MCIVLLRILTLIVPSTQSSLPTGSQASLTIEREEGELKNSLVTNILSNF